MLHYLLTIGLLLIITGCQIENKPNYNLADSCFINNGSSCPTGQYCALNANNVARCYREYKGELPLIAFPFPPGTKVMCSQGSRSEPGETHAYWSTFFALDLYGDNQASEIIAGNSGIALVENSCSPTHSGSDCGGKYGNHVIIFSEDNFAVLYAHLTKVYVANGDFIKIGDLLGLEGRTGLATDRHLHISAHYNWREKGYDYYLENSGYLPKNIPFITRICDPKIQYQCKPITIHVDDFPCGSFHTTMPIQSP